MRILVLGAGVIGTTTAYYLARNGASVTVLDRQPGVALETSFANAGQISPGYSTPWPAPGIPAKALKWMFSRHAPLSFRPDGSLWQLQWLAQLWRNCSADRYAVNKARMVRLAEYSRDCLQALRAETGIHYEQRCGGTLQLFRTAQQLAHARRDIAVLEQCGVAHRLLVGDQLFSVEPALAAARVPLTGGLHLPGDETGDCYLFTQRLAERARQLGVTFRFGAAIDALIAGDRRRIAGVRAGGELLRADHYVVACGSYSRALLAPLGIDVPVYPVKGYSLTAPVGDDAHALRSTVIDESYKVALTRFDARLRVGGMAELSGFDLRLNPRRRATLEKITTELLPGTDLSAPLFWTGLRPMTPDGTPVIGATQWQNLSLNTGHGTLGWTMACGSAQLLADLIAGRPPAIAADDLGWSRYARGARPIV